MDGALKRCGLKTKRFFFFFGKVVTSTVYRFLYRLWHVFKRHHYSLADPFEKSEIPRCRTIPNRREIVHRSGFEKRAIRPRLGSPYSIISYYVPWGPRDFLFSPRKFTSNFCHRTVYGNMLTIRFAFAVHKRRTHARPDDAFLKFLQRFLTFGFPSPISESNTARVGPFDIFS